MARKDAARVPRDPGERKRKEEMGPRSSRGVVAGRQRAEADARRSDGDGQAVREDLKNPENRGGVLRWRNHGER